MARRKKGLSFYSKERKVNKGLIAEIFSWIFWGLAMVLAAFVFMYCFGIRTDMSGASMKPTLTNGQKVLMNRFVYYVSEPKSGDVIVFLPNGNTGSHYYIRRVIAGPGETIRIEDGVIYVDGFFYEDGFFYDKIADAGIAENDIVLGEDEYFVLGDNRNDSEDSRSSNIGIVRREYIEGRVWFKFSDGNMQMGLIK